MHSWKWAGVVMILAAATAFAQEGAAPIKLKHSDVVFMGSAKKEIYEAYGATVVDWGGGAWKNEAKPIAEFRARVKMAQDMGIQYNAGIPMVTGFAGMIASCPEYEKAVCRDIEGKPIFVPWLWDQKYKGKTGFNYWFCSNSPLYQKFLRDVTERAMKGEPDGYHIDDYGGTTGSMWSGGCFCDSCMEGFRKYLAANVAPEKLKELGIEKLDDFNYGKFLLAKCVKNADEYRKKRGSLPLNEEFTLFEARAAGEVVRGLQEYAVKLRGKPLVRCVNGAPPSQQAFIVMPHMDHYSCEIGMNAPNKKFAAGAAFTYKCGDMIDRGIAGTASGQDWAYAQENKATNVVRCWIAEAYAMGQCFMTPGQHQWAYTEKKGTHSYEGKPEDFAYLYQFVRKNAALFDGYEAVAQVGVLFSDTAWRKGKRDPQAIAACLLDANVPFALVAAGDEYLALRMSEKDAGGFEKIIVPAEPMLDAEQQAVLAKLTEAKKTVVWKGEGRAGAAPHATLVPQIESWVSVEGAKGVWALPRRVPNRADSPLIVHLLNRNYDFAADKMLPQQNIVLHISKSLLGRKPPAQCKVFSPDAEPALLSVEPDGDGAKVKVPELKMWALVQFE